MSMNRRLLTDADFQEALEREKKIRVFQDNAIIDMSSSIVRFDDDTVVTQSGVGDLMYHRRSECEFFELRRRS
ncbi:hypothetical protein M6D81_19915 [Paenibacillus sp. J5C_2022]|uniref:hypothetical protein n=1 Tax=Paenibacillus sp. J5C2022 TaxID=2977129 RepID=UPI0021D08F98|nr:hypothetical protein [Paenibacillus sp. J5C2022]MCU6710967.1 hypothetical protein [Paenibacillus sp. J5C2022]